MTNTIKELYSRKSVRVFIERDIEPEKREAILQSAMAAPTAGNQQLYTIIDIQSQNQKDQLSILCDNQPFISKAPLVLVFCADCKKWYDLFNITNCNPRNPGVGDLMLSVTDSCIAAQNAVVAAESMGIGSCYIGDIMENSEEMKKCLSLPEFVFPCAMVVFGYPTEQQKNRQKPERHTVEDIVCVDKYQCKNSDELKQMFYKNYKTSDLYTWSKSFCDRKYNSDFSKEMTRSVEQYLKDFE